MGSGLYCIFPVFGFDDLFLHCFSSEGAHFQNFAAKSNFAAKWKKFAEFYAFFKSEEHLITLDLNRCDQLTS